MTIPIQSTNWLLLWRLRFRSKFHKKSDPFKSSTHIQPYFHKIHHNIIPLYRYVILGLRNDPFSWGFITRILYAFIISSFGHAATCPAKLTPVNQSSRSSDVKSGSSSVWYFIHDPVTFSFLAPDIFLRRQTVWRPSLCNFYIFLHIALISTLSFLTLKRL